jgi:hypothetical protein
MREKYLESIATCVDGLDPGLWGKLRGRSRADGRCSLHRGLKDIDAANW